MINEYLSRYRGQTIAANVLSASQFQLVELVAVDPDGVWLRMGQVDILWSASQIQSVASGGEGISVPTIPTKTAKSRAVQVFEKSKATQRVKVPLVLTLMHPPAIPPASGGASVGVGMGIVFPMDF